VFVSWIQILKASTQESNDLSDANLFSADSNWMMRSFCSELWSLIRFASSSTSADISEVPSLPNLIKGDQPPEQGM
jgi:hypothetical protein